MSFGRGIQRAFASVVVRPRLPALLFLVCTLGGAAGTFMRFDPGILIFVHRPSIAYYFASGQECQLRPVAVGSRCPGRAWPAGDFQQRSRFAVHGRGVYRSVGIGRRGDQHGRTRESAGQRVRGTLVAECEVRGGVFEGLWRRLGSGSVAGAVLPLLLRAADPSSLGLSHADGSVPGKSKRPIKVFGRENSGLAPGLQGTSIASVAR